MGRINAKVDEVTRTRMWQDEGRVVVFDRHIIGISDIDRVYNIRRKIGCGSKGCMKDGAYEAKMRF